MDVILFQASEEQKVPKEQLYKTVQSILDEIGYNRRLPVIRWLGLLLLKVLKRTCNGLYVNETSINRVSFYQDWLVLVLAGDAEGTLRCCVPSFSPSTIFMHYLYHPVITSFFFLMHAEWLPHHPHIHHLILIFVWPCLSTTTVTIFFLF